MEGRGRRGSSTGRGRFGRGRGGGRKYSELKKRPVLPSNSDRYEEGPKEEVDPHVPVPNSQGEDLETLLNNLKLTEWSAYSHYCSIVADLNSEPPIATDGSHPKELSLDTSALAAALSLLPLEQVIGIDTKFLKGIQNLQNPVLDILVDYGAQQSLPLKSEKEVPQPKPSKSPKDESGVNMVKGHPGSQVSIGKAPKSLISSKSTTEEVKMVKNVPPGEFEDDEDDLDMMLSQGRKETQVGKSKSGWKRTEKKTPGDEDDLDALLDMSRSKTSGGATKGAGGNSLESWMDDL